MFLAKKLNKGVGTSAPSVDAQFNYVTMLLHGDGTNGAQNNTFIDSSSNNFTITRNGNTTQGSFGPFGSNWSNYFGTNSSYLTLPSNSAFDLGTGAYTVEAWVYLTSYAASNEIVMFCNGNASGAIACSINTGGQIHLSKYGSGQVITGSSGDVPLNQWNHIAYVRTSTSSNDTKLYVNGVVKATGTDSNNWNVITTPTVGGLTISGYGIIGNISNVRVVKGTAVYTSAFTPSTTPLTAISGTSLLTCQNNRFTDNSTNTFNVTATGTLNVQRFNPFGASAAYSTSVIGGSGYFDGSGDYLTVPDSSATDLGSGDFTVECWFYQFAYKVASCISLTGALSGNGYALGAAGSSSNKIWWYAAGTQILSSTTITYNAWNHVAVVRSSGTTTMYLNGANVGSFSDSKDYSGGITYIGSDEVGTQDWNGYISNARIVKGTAVYTSAFTPTTAPLTAITNTSVLINFINGAIYDNAMINDLETVGNAQISTSVKKYGTGSLSFDGTGDYLLAPVDANQNFNFGSGDFTVEMWFYANSLSSSSYAGLCGCNNSVSNNEWGAYVRSNGIFFYGGGGKLIGGGTISTGTWYHFAASKTSTTVRVWLDGVQVGVDTGVTGSYINSSVGFRVGDDPDAGNPAFNGYIDDLRITKGFCRYTATFTPPTVALSDIGPN